MKSKLYNSLLGLLMVITFISCNNSSSEKNEIDRKSKGKEKEEVVILRSGEANGNRFFVNQEGDTLFGGKTFYNTYEFKGGYCVVKQKINDTVKTGIINDKGEVMVPIKFTEYLEGYEPGGYFKMYRKGSGTGYIDSTGKVVIPPIYSETKGVKDGMVKLRNKARPQKWGVLDMEGNTVIPFEYDQIGIWRDDLAWVYDKNKGYGFVNKTGERVIDFQYDNVKSFEEGIALVVKDEKIAFIDTKNNLITDFEFDNYKEIVDVSEDPYNMDGSGFKQTNHRFITEEGYILLEKNGKWGYINKKGEEVIPFDFDWVDLPESGGDKVRVGKDGKRGYYDIPNKKVDWNN